MATHYQKNTSCNIKNTPEGMVRGVESCKVKKLHEKAEWSHAILKTPPSFYI